MEKGKENENKTKPRSMRLSDEIMEKFKELTKDCGGNQQRTFERLIEVYEHETMRSSNIEQQDNIDTFEGYLHILNGMYISALQTNKDMKKIIREEFRVKLESKDQIIEELQNRVKEAEKISQDFELKKQQYEENNKNLSNKVNNLEKSFQELQNTYCQEKKSSQEEISSLKLTVQELTNNLTKNSQLLSDTTAENSNLVEKQKNLKTQIELLSSNITTKNQENTNLQLKIEQLNEIIADAETRTNQEIAKTKELFQFELEKSLFEQRKKLQDEYEKRLEKILEQIVNQLGQKITEYEKSVIQSKS